MSLHRPLNPFSNSIIPRYIHQKTLLRPLRQTQSKIISKSTTSRSIAHFTSRSTQAQTQAQIQMQTQKRQAHSSQTAASASSSSSSSAPSPSPSQIVRPLVPPPDARSGPLLSRRPDRELPDVRNKRTWLKTLPIFIALITVSSLAIFNYQKSSSSTVNSILYALRTNQAVRDILGDEIYFAAKVPWIRGELNQLHGNIDISFWVKGTKGMAQTKFVSVRKRRNGYFETLEWSLKTADGRVIQLLDLEGAKDPMNHVVKE